MKENQWKYIECTEDLPPIGEYVLGKFDDDFICILSFIDGEWETGASGRRAIYKGKEKFHTSCDPQWWRPLI